MKIDNGSTVFDVLNDSFDIEFKEYSGLGKLVTGIDGVQQNSTHYWLYYVNNEFAQVAADKYILDKDSSILFKFTSEYEFDG
jgi:hypothetical protein